MGTGTLWPFLVISGTVLYKILRKITLKYSNINIIFIINYYYNRFKSFVSPIYKHLQSAVPFVTIFGHIKPVPKLTIRRVLCILVTFLFLKLKEIF